MPMIDIGRSASADDVEAPELELLDDDEVEPELEPEVDAVGVVGGGRDLVEEVAEPGGREEPAHALHRADDDVAELRGGGRHGADDRGLLGDRAPG